MNCGRPRLDLAGMRFGMLVVIENCGVNRWRNAIWKVLCDCGNKKVVIGSLMVNGSTTSCGCKVKENCRRLGSDGHNIRHGAHDTAEYAAYMKAKGRCQNPNDQRYSYYGGRGIEFHFESFEQFFAELGKKPTPKHSIDRIDNNGHYEAGNVRWATQSEQCINRRPTGSSGVIGIRQLPHGKWRAQIPVNGKLKHIGCYPTKDAAIAAQLEHRPKAARVEVNCER